MTDEDNMPKKERIIKAVSSKPIGFYLTLLLALNLVTNTFLIFSVNSLSEEVYSVSREIGYVSSELGDIQRNLENIEIELRVIGEKGPNIP